MDILFSIIVPVYNVEAFLKKCVQSIQNQTYSNYEIILIDDGSTDNSGKICDEFSKMDYNISIIHQENQGLSEARNVGIQNAKGDYIIFIDSDDFIKNTMLYEIFNVIKKGNMPDVILPIGWYKVYENKILLVDTFEVSSIQAEISGMEALNYYLENEINGWTACGKCFSKRFWKVNNFSFKPGIYYEDAQLIYKVIARAVIVKTVPAGYYYRKVRQDSILSKPKAKLILDYMMILDEWNDYLIHAEYEKKTKELIKKAFAKEYVTSILPTIVLFDKKQKKQLIYRARQLKYYLTYSKDYLTRIAKLMSKIFGFTFTCRVLYFLKKIKGKMT